MKIKTKEFNKLKSVECVEYIGYLLCNWSGIESQLLHVHLCPICRCDVMIVKYMPIDNFKCCFGEA